MNKNIVFNEADHSYTIDGQPLKSVTQLLQDYELSPKYYGNAQAAAKRGKYVHKAIELYLRNNLDEDSLSPPLIPYFRSFKDFWEKQEADTWESEEMVGSLLWGLAGTIDWYGNLNEEITIIDFKTGKKVYDSAWLQLGLYKHLLEQGSEVYKYKTKVLHITPQKTEIVEDNDPERTKKVVEAILTLENHKRRKQED
ncbi:MAG: PD-(D/E)XK nuclease family protein [candidate division WOR-3 bacterium]|nr:PD-(D/E)XK nuclease family protein [candidate division WOR-3 bacterium]